MLGVNVNSVKTYIVINSIEGFFEIKALKIGCLFQKTAVSWNKQAENEHFSKLLSIKATPRNSRNRILRNGTMTKRTESPRLCSRKAHGFRPAGNACQPEPSSPARTAYSVWRSASAVLGIAFFGTGTALWWPWCIPKKVDKRAEIWYNNRHTSKEGKRCQQPNTMKTSKSHW